MAEELLGGMLGADDEDKPEVEGPDPLVATEAFAAAVAARLSGNDPGVARETEEFLRHQSRLLKIQAEHLTDEHQLRVQHLRNQLQEEGIRGFSLRLRVAFQVFIALVATLIGLGVLVFLRDVFTSRRVIIDPFHAPPGLAVRGIDGTVVASGLLDELSRLQDSTRSAAAAYSLSSAWADNIKVDVSESGISIGELSRILRARFGHDVHIAGDLTELLGGGYALSVRGNGVPSQTFSGAANELPKLTTQAAEYIYSKSQPARWSAYLTNAGRTAEAIEFCRTAVASADPETRAELLNTWANASVSIGGSARDAMQMFEEAVRLAPRSWRSYANLMNSQMVLQDEEGAWRTGNLMLKVAGGRPSGREAYIQNWDYLTWNLLPWRDAMVEDAAHNAGVGSFSGTAGPTIADVQMRLHESQAAALSLETTKEDPNDPTIGAMTHFVRGRLAADAGDIPIALAQMQAFAKAYSDPNVSSNDPGYNCWVAPVLEMAGHPEQADALLASAGSFVDCYRFRADILDGRGRWAEAQTAYARAVALAPDLPAAYYSFGLALARHGDLKGAAVQLENAHRRGPHWADPLKAWGDVLLWQGHRREANAKYKEALQYAPDWAELKKSAADAQRAS